MSKTRVSELAKRYNVKSNEVITMLGELGEFVKTASSSIELPAVKKFEARFGAELEAKMKPAAPAAEPAPAAAAAP
ncbi:MAG: translation initiation factor IF-2 N-terminal domain-containing protein, partial [Nocardioides sp.]